MTTLNFKVPVLGADGQPGPSNLNDLFSGLLMNSPIKGAVSAKYFYWALELVKSGVLTVDDPDIKTLKDFIEESDSLTVLGRGRLLEVFNPKPAMQAVPDIVSE